MLETPSRPALSRTLGAAVALAAVVAAGLGILAPSPAADTARVLPAPALDERPGPAASEVAVLAGGCFWGVQGVFQHVRGVTRAVSGYTGGEAGTAQYETVSSGGTRHAESVQVTFDPRQISFGRL